ncbi:MAG: hypothetical protein HY303_19250 [Candidatus Wallbacteria bacterium]|nr:hypothetical protein [Candidatus Wallbacteria bacterium]
MYSPSTLVVAIEKWTATASSRKLERPVLATPIWSFTTGPVSEESMTRQSVAYSHQS